MLSHLFTYSLVASCRCPHLGCSRHLGALGQRSHHRAPGQGPGLTCCQHGCCGRGAALRELAPPPLPGSSARRRGCWEPRAVSSGSTDLKLWMPGTVQKKRWESHHLLTSAANRTLSPRACSSGGTAAIRLMAASRDLQRDTLAAATAGPFTGRAWPVGAHAGDWNRQGACHTMSPRKAVGHSV